MRKNNYIYHYTTTDVLFSIVANQKWWFCDMNESNDKFENCFLYKQYSKYYFKKHKSKPTIPDYIYERTKSYKLYAACFSKNRDSLHQWLTYARRNGVCLVIDKAILSTYFKDFKAFQKNMKEGIVKYPVNSDELNCYFDTKEKEYDNIIGIIGKIVEDSPFYKPDEWKIENEYRFCFNSFINEGLNNKVLDVCFKDLKIPLKYIYRNGSLVTHYEVPFPISCIKGIIIGPNNSIDRNKLFESLKMFEDDENKLGFDKKDIKKTKTSIQ